MKASDTRLCALDDLSEGASKGWSDDPVRTSAELILVRKKDQIFAYRNACPHTGVSMEWTPDRFLDINKHFIQCGVHGALFRVEDGFCVSGPCVGSSLEAVEVEVSNGEVMLRCNG